MRSKTVSKKPFPRLAILNDIVQLLTILFLVITLTVVSSSLAYLAKNFY